MSNLQDEIAKRHNQIQEINRLRAEGVYVGPELGEALHFDPKAEKIFMECRTGNEPMIIFRAKDILALMVIAHYQGLVEQYLPECTEFQERISEKAREVRQWQRENPSRVHLPD